MVLGVLNDLVEAALQKETNKTAKQAFTEARAAILLFKPDATEADKIEAVATVRARGDQEALALLSGLPAETSPAVLRTAASAVSSIQSSLAVWSTAQNA